MNDEIAWRSRKRHFVERLELEYKIGRVDADIKPLLDAINNCENYYTTSSCSGRIQVTLNKLPGDKFDIVTVAKWHRCIETDELQQVLNELIADKTENAWFAVQPPIIHVVAKNLDAALDMLATARHCGFKHSGIQSIKKYKVVVEITGSERIEVPLIYNRLQLVNFESLSVLVDVANKVLTRSKEKMEKLRKLISDGGLGKSRTG